jgi:hypothetical protein
MLKIVAKLAGMWFGLRGKARLKGYAPYPDAATNTLYNVLFCDDLGFAKKHQPTSTEGPWKTLFAAPADQLALQALAADTSQESRVRVLAYNALLKMSAAPQKKELLGIIVEVGLRAGLETLAAYRDGQASYIDKSGQVLIWESPGPEIKARIEKLFRAGEAVVAQTGPWGKPRLIPPPQGVVRVTLLVSDGLYFGHGPIAVLQQDPIGGPVIAVATELLAALTATAQTGEQRKGSI